MDYDTCRMKFSESEVLMRKSQQKIMMNKVKDFIKDFTMIQQDYEKKIQERLIRQYSIINPNDDVTKNVNTDNRYQVFADEVYKIHYNYNILVL